MASKRLRSSSSTGGVSPPAASIAAARRRTTAALSSPALGSRQDRKRLTRRDSRQPRVDRDDRSPQERKVRCSWRRESGEHLKSGNFGLDSSLARAVFLLTCTRALGEYDWCRLGTVALLNGNGTAPWKARRFDRGSEEFHLSSTSRASACAQPALPGYCQSGTLGGRSRGVREACPAADHRAERSLCDE